MQFFIEAAIAVLVAVLTVASAEADFGYFIPKAFYTLDADGHKMQPHPVSPHTAQYLRRLRRQAFSSSSSSSSSSASSSNGGPVYFSTQNTVSHTPAGTVSFSSRFGDDGGTGSGGSYSGSGYDGTGYGSTGFAGNHAPGNNHHGHKNNHYDGTNLGNRFGSSASSSSSVSSNGGPVYFKTEQSVKHTPTSNINVANRFGGDVPQTVSKTVSTSGYIDEKGVHAKTTTTKTH